MKPDFATNNKEIIKMDWTFFTIGVWREWKGKMFCLLPIKRIILLFNREDHGLH